MTIYIIAALFPFVLDLVFEGRQQDHHLKGRERKRKVVWFVLLASIPMIVILGLRHVTIGTDTRQYVYHFRKVRRLNLVDVFNYSETEPVLYLLMYFCAQVSDDASFFIFVDAVIVTIAFVVFAVKNNDGELLTTMFYVTLGSFFFMITGMRQALAIAFCLFAVDCIRRRKLLLFALCIILAFYSHRSSIMFVVLYLIGYRKLTFGNMAINIIVSFLFVVFFDNFQSLFNEALDYSYEIESTGNGGIFLAVVIILNAIAFYMKDEVLKEKPDAVVLYNGSMISLTLWVARLFTRTAERPSYFFLPCTYAVAAMAIQSVKSPQQRILFKIGAFVLSIALMIYRLTNARALSPFIFTWAR